MWTHSSSWYNLTFRYMHTSHDDTRCCPNSASRRSWRSCFARRNVSPYIVPLAQLLIITHITDTVALDIHSEGLAHTNICPANIIFTRPFSQQTRYSITSEDLSSEVSIVMHTNIQTDYFQLKLSLVTTEVRLCFYGDTRHEGVMVGSDRYRSPEVIAGTPLILPRSFDVDTSVRAVCRSEDRPFFFGLRYGGNCLGRGPVLSC